MKKVVFLALALTLIFCSCADSAGESAADTPAANNEPAGEKISLYDSDGIRFDIPEAWQQNFKAVTREAGSSGNTYPQTDFYYTVGERDIRLMSIGKFTREQWESLKKNEQGAEDALLGESEDKNHIYSVYYENHDYIQDEDLKGILSGIKQEAQALRDKIKLG